MELKVFAKDQKKDVEKRYYYWEFSVNYGWCAIGNLTGYNSLEELKKDRFTYKQDETIYAILESQIIEQNYET